MLNLQVADAGEVAVNLNFTLSSGIKNLKEPVIRKISSVRVNKSFKATFKYYLCQIGVKTLTKKLQVVGAVPAHRLAVSSSSLKKNVIILVP